MKNSRDIVSVSVSVSVSEIEKKVCNLSRNNEDFPVLMNFCTSTVPGKVNIMRIGLFRLSYTNFYIENVEHHKYVRM